MSLASRMKTLFSGMDEAYGTYIIDESNKSKGKKKQGKAFTKRERVTEELWELHVKGEQALGIIPIKKNNKCLWGAVDIDSYDLDLPVFAKKVYEKKLPLFPMRSKSGGCHLVMFLEEELPAAYLQEKLTEIAAHLGFGRSEIFPKQSTVLVDKGDLGNWLNMPYYGGDDSTRYAIDQNGKRMSIALFLAEAERSRVSEETLDNMKLMIKANELADGPPCLQVLVDQGFPQGTRNNGLFALGVYARKAHPDGWEAKLEELNTKYMDPPLESKEVQIIIKQIGRKEYNFRCNDQPIVNYCNAGVCRTRQFGIGGGAMPVMKSLRKIPTDQPVWFLEVNSQTLELSTEELQVQGKFQKACMNLLNKMPPRQTDRQWQAIVQTLLDDCEVLEKPEGASISDQFEDFLFSFCTDEQSISASAEDLLLGRPWLGADPLDDNSARVFFRIKNLDEYLVRNGFKYYTRSQMIAKLTNVKLNARKHFMTIKGRGVNLWHIKPPQEQDEPFGLPDMGEAVL